MPIPSLQDLLAQRHQIIKDISQAHFVQDAEGRHVIDGQYALINRVNRKRAKALEQQIGLVVVEVSNASEAKLYPGKIVFVKEAPASEPIVLGAGNFGHAKLAEKLSDGTIVVVKKLKSREAQYASYLEMVLQHRLQDKPHILKLYDSYLSIGHKSQEPVLYYFMPLAGLGGNVGRLRQELSQLEDIKLKDLILTRIIKGILLGSYHMHREQIVHGDHKPANWLVDEKGEAYVADFGCAVLTGPDLRVKPGKETIQDEQDHEIEIIIGGGDASYCLPEKSAGWEKNEAFNGGAADKWAIGVGLTELITGRAIADRYLLREEVQQLLNTCQDLPQLADLALQLIADPSPSWEQLLNHPSLQRPEAHAEQLQETAINYLKAFVKQSTRQVLKNVNAKVDYNLGDGEENQAQETIVTKEENTQALDEAEERRSENASGYITFRKSNEIQEQPVEIRTDDNSEGHYITRYYGHEVKVGETWSKRRSLAHSDHQTNFPLPQSFHTRLALSLSHADAGLSMEADRPIPLTLSLIAPLLRSFTSEGSAELTGPYIPLAGALTPDGNQPFDLQTHVQHWLATGSSNTLLLLAEGGSGKSSFCLHLVSILQQAFKQAMAKADDNNNNNLNNSLAVWDKKVLSGHYLPIYIRLNTVRNPKTVFTDTLREQYGYSSRQIEALKELALVIIFDGCDELKELSNFYVDNELHLWPQLKLLYTCRPSALGKDYEIYFLPYQHGKEAQARFEEYYVLPFSPERVQQYIQSYVQHQALTLKAHAEAKALEPQWLEAATYEKALSQQVGLQVLAQNPYRLKLLLQILPTLSQGKHDHQLSLQAVDIYQAANEQRKEKELSKLGLSGEELKAALKEAKQWEQKLAEVLYEERAVTISYQPLWRFNPETSEYEIFLNQQDGRWQGLLGDNQHAQAMRRALGLRRLTETSYGFEHLSQLEYWQAKCWYEELRALGLPKEGYEENWRKQAENLGLNCYPLTYTFNGKSEFQRTTKDNAKLDFLTQWVYEDSEYKALLFQVIESSKITQKLDVLSANSVTVLNGAHVSLCGLDWSGIRMLGAVLDGARLDGTKLRSADARYVSCRQVSLRGADLRGANLTQIQFGQWPMLRCEDTVTCVALANEGKWIVGLANGKIQLWKQGRLLRTFIGHTKAITSVAVQGDTIVSGSEDKTLRIWNLTTGQPVGKPLQEHTAEVRSVVVQGDRIVSGSEDKTLRIWNLATGQPVGEPLLGHMGAVTTAAVQGDTIVSGSEDKTLRIWNLTTGQPVGEPLQRHRGRPMGRVTSVAVQGSTIISGSRDGNLRLWNLATGQPVGEPLQGHGSGIWSVAVQGDRIVSGGSDRTVRLWNLATGQPVGESLLGHGGRVTSVAVQGGRIVSGSQDRSVRCWDLATGQPMGKPLQGHMGMVMSVAIGDGLIVSGGGYKDETVRCWDTKTGKPVGEPLQRHRGEVWGVAVQGDRIVSGSGNRTLQIWDLVTGQPMGEPLQRHTGAVTSIAVQGDRIVSGSTDKTVLVWNLVTGQPVGKPLQGHTAEVRSVAVQGDWIVSGSWDNTIRIWDLVTGQPVGKPLQGHTDSILSVAVQDGTIVSGSQDRTLRIWDGATGRCRTILTFYWPVDAVALQGSYLIVSTGETIQAWQHDALQDCWLMCWSRPDRWWGLEAQGCQLAGAIGLTSDQIELLEQLGAKNASPSTSATQPMKSLTFVQGWVKKGIGFFTSSGGKNTMNQDAKTWATSEKDSIELLPMTSSLPEDHNL